MTSFYGSSCANNGNHSGGGRKVTKFRDFYWKISRKIGPIFAVQTPPLAARSASWGVWTPPQPPDQLPGGSGPPPSHPISFLGGLDPPPAARSASWGG
eukprot:1180483-Prorocentrum_minimum.AAC.3